LNASKTKVAAKQIYNVNKSIDGKEKLKKVTEFQIVSLKGNSRVKKKIYES
jgi:uncharacterized protein (UPF0333 family)